MCSTHVSTMKGISFPLDLSFNLRKYLSYLFIYVFILTKTKPLRIAVCQEGLSSVMHERRTWDGGSEMALIYHQFVGHVL